MSINSSNKGIQETSIFSHGTCSRSKWTPRPDFRSFSLISTMIKLSKRRSLRLLPWSAQNEQLSFDYNLYSNANRYFALFIEGLMSFQNSEVIFILL